MDKALYIAMSGAKQNMLAQANHANNLANASTTAFKADLAQARSQGVYYGEGYPTRAYAMTENHDTSFERGSLVVTGRDLDVAIEGEGWLAVQMPDGSEAYTRAGNLEMDAAGFLRTPEGFAVLGNGGPITVPNQEKIEIGIDGTITIRAQGLGPETLLAVDRLRLVNPDVTQMEKYEDGMFRLRDGTNAQPDAAVRVIGGYLEASNVNTVEALTEILGLSRQYEMQVRMMQTTQEMSESTARLLQLS